MMPKTNEDEYNFDPEYEPLDGQFNNIFEKEDNNLTVGQMFCGADLQSASKKDVLNEYQYDSSPDNEESATKKSNTRCSRGLKVLSVKVRDIVYQKKRTSYKEVAEALISENNISGAFSPTLNRGKNKKKAKEEQNVKRRVYDALNVLIAADVLRKANKTVYFNEMEKGIGRNFKQEKKELINKLDSREKRYKEQKQLLQTLLHKFIAIRTLLNRNRTRDVPSHVKFPFLLIAPAPGNDTEVTLEMQPNYKKLLLQSNKEVKMSGDLEVLMMLKMHYKVDTDLFNSICNEDFGANREFFLDIMEQDYLNYIGYGVSFSGLR